MQLPDVIDLSLLKRMMKQFHAIAAQVTALDEFSPESAHNPQVDEPRVQELTTELTTAFGYYQLNERGLLTADELILALSSKEMYLMIQQGIEEANSMMR